MLSPCVRALSTLLLSVLFALCRAPSVHADGAKFAGTGPTVSSIVEALRTAELKALKPVGTSSVVFKVDLDGAIDAAFRPESRLNPRGHFAEVAAFRLARALGLDNVAPALVRTVSWTELTRLIKASRPEALKSIERDIVIRDGHVVCAAIYWIPDLHELGLDKPDGVTRFTRWLAQDGPLPSDEKERSMAAQLSTMLGFDYLIANFDRFSGANMQGNATGETLFLRDHNMAFFEPLRTPHHQRVLGRLKRAQRFSRSFVAALRALDGPQLSGALAERGDKSANAVLTPGQLRGLLDRRSALLSYIAALIDTYGERNVLTFP